MIGIDITDLSDPLLKDRKKALRLISNPLDKIESRDFWSLWTSKEAVYKAQRKKIPFQPKSIPIQFINDHKFISDNLKGQVKITDEYVLSLIFGSKLKNYKIFNRETENPSTEIRQKIKKWFWDSHQIHTAVIPDDNDLPILSHNLSPVSISHHGKYLAFTWQNL